MNLSYFFFNIKDNKTKLNRRLVKKNCHKFDKLQLKIQLCVINTKVFIYLKKGYYLTGQLFNFLGYVSKAVLVIINYEIIT